MKRILAIVSVMVLAVFSAQAQKIGFINSDSVLTTIPDYARAQDSLKALAAAYKADMEKDLQYIDNLYSRYQEQKSYLSSASCASREQQIISLEDALKKKQEKYFGTDGLMSKRSEALLTPIKNKVNALVKEYCKTNGYSAIFDMAATTGLMYYDKDKDITSIIIEKLK